jgi:NADPH:quinone reductase-like Zn-dependent oxidoreductase
VTYILGMRAWILDSSPGAYRFGEVECPPPGPGEVRIAVRASALNHMDLWVTRGTPRPALPHVPGCDAVGTVESVGDGVEGLREGDEVVVNPGISPVRDMATLGVDSPLSREFRIWGEHTWGGHADLAVAPARNVRPVPAGRSLEECAAFPVAYLTALRMLRRGRVGRGTRVLVVGIGSGVSCAALDLAKHMGAHVSVTSRDGKKLEEASRRGADVLVDTRAESWGVEAEVVIESVGAATWEKSVESLVPGGRLVVCGGSSGGEVTLRLPRLWFRQHEIIGSTMGSYQEFDTLLRMMEEGLPVAVDSVCPFADYPAALERLARGRQLGKVVLAHG